jgi:hypothetical protein
MTSGSSMSCNSKSFASPLLVPGKPMPSPKYISGGMPSPQGLMIMLSLVMAHSHKHLEKNETWIQSVTYPAMDGDVCTS